jgi:lactoylglutathione lyase
MAICGIMPQQQENRPMQDNAESYHLLHTMIRVKDLDRALHFYCELLGMRLLRRKDYPEGKFSNLFVGYGDEAAHTVIELTYNWEQETPYSLGDAWGHLAVGVPDIHAACERLAAAGAPIPRPPGPMKHGTTVIAFVEDPDGRKVELIERKPAA